MSIMYESSYARDWQTEYALIDQEYEAVTDKDQVHKASVYGLPEEYQQQVNNRAEQEEALFAFTFWYVCMSDWLINRLCAQIAYKLD